MKKVLFCLVLLCLAGLPALAKAQETQWNSADYVQARLIAGIDQDDKRRNILAGLDIRLSEGWHAYWRMPGDGGLPPQLDWSGSENLEVIEVHWPVPRRFEIFGLQSFGYEDVVLLPVSVRRLDSSLPAKLHLKADIMVCNEICVPQQVGLKMDIPAQPDGRDIHTLRLEKALEKVPHRGELPVLKIENAVVGPDAVVVNAYSQSGFDRADLFVEAGDIYVTARPEITPDTKDPRRAMIRVAAPEGVDNLADIVMGEKVRLTLVNGRDAVEKEISF